MTTLEATLEETALKTPASTNTRTYFGDTIEEVLATVREELGPDALIVRQREGIIGGIGGFFGRKCVEVEARPAETTPPSQSVPPRAIIDAYATGEGFEPLFDNDLPLLDRLDREQPPVRNGLEAMLAQSAPFMPSSAFTPSSAFPEPPMTATPLTASFAETLADVVADSGAFDEGDADLQQATTPLPVTRLRQGGELVPTGSHTPSEEMGELRAELLAAALPVRLAGEILAEARFALAPFDPDSTMRELARRSLARRITVASPRRTGRRRLAVIGAAGAGRTLASASLASAYARSGRSVTALSLEPARDAMRLAGLVTDEVTFDVADAPDLVTRACRTLGDTEILVADLPPIVDSIDPGRLDATISLLQSLEPDETHLVLRASATEAEAAPIFAALAPHRLPTRVIISHCDDLHATGVAVGLALAHKIPVAFLSSGNSVGALRPAEPTQLAQMVLR